MSLIEPTIIFITKKLHINQPKKQKQMTREQILGIVRHALTFVGGVLVAKGFANEASITELIGSAMTLVGAVWSVVKNKQ